MKKCVSQSQDVPILWFPYCRLQRGHNMHIMYTDGVNLGPSAIVLRSMIACFFTLCAVVNRIMGQWKDWVLIEGRSWFDGSVSLTYLTMVTLLTIKNNSLNILYDFSGHKPDLEGEIQICFRYGFSRPASVYKQWDHKSARPDLHVSTQKADIRNLYSLYTESTGFFRPVIWVIHIEVKSIRPDISVFP